MKESNTSKSLAIANTVNSFMFARDLFGELQDILKSQHKYPQT